MPSASTTGEVGQPKVPTQSWTQKADRAQPIDESGSDELDLQAAEEALEAEIDAENAKALRRQDKADTKEPSESELSEAWQVSSNNHQATPTESQSSDAPSSAPSTQQQTFTKRRLSSSLPTGTDQPQSKKSKHEG